MRLIVRGIAPLMLAAMAAPAFAQDPPEPAPPTVITTSPPAPVVAPVPTPPVPEPAPPVAEAPPTPSVAPVPTPSVAPVPTPPVPEPAPPVAEAPPVPPSPYRRCSSVGRGQVTTAPCDLRIVDGRPPRLWLRIERNLPSPPAAVILIWRERDDVGGVIHRISGRALGSPGAAAGTLFSIPVSARFCAPSGRRFDVELELADGRNIGRIGQFAFPCGR